MVAISIVPVGRLACAYFHASAHHSRVDRFGMSLILILSLSVEIPIDTRSSCVSRGLRGGQIEIASYIADQRDTRPSHIGLGVAVEVDVSVLTFGLSDGVAVVGSTVSRSVYALNRPSNSNTIADR
jgi:hypothetical protein